MSVDIARASVGAATSTRPRTASALESLDRALPDIQRRLAALDDPTRLRILAVLDAAPASSVSAIAATIGHTANTVTQALARLHQLGIVARVRDGRLSRWSISDTAIHALLVQLAEPAALR